MSVIEFKQKKLKSAIGNELYIFVGKEFSYIAKADIGNPVAIVTGFPFQLLGSPSNEERFK